jgi:hypothetical protein
LRHIIRLLLASLAASQPAATATMIQYHSTTGASYFSFLIFSSSALGK